MDNMINGYYNVSPGSEQFQPPYVRGVQTLPARAMAWRGLLYDLLFSVWKIGLPSSWLPSPFRYMLFGYGSLGVVYSDALGWVYGYYGVEKIGWQWEPLTFHVTLANDPEGANPIRGVRGINGAVLHVRDDWAGFDPLITQYAQMLAACDKGLEINLRQSRYGKVYGVENQKDAQAIKQAYVNADNGDPIVIVSKRLLGEDGQLKVSNLMGDVAKDYLGDKLMETRLMLIKEFLTRVGVRTVGLEKREHLLNQEIAENNDETGAEPYVISTSLQPEVEILRGLGCPLEIRQRYDYSGAGTGEEDKTDGKE